MRSQAASRLGAPWPQHQVGLLGFGEPQRDPGKEQVPERQDLLARILHGRDHGDADCATLGEKSPTGRRRCAG
jgi:hypothetical protein